VKHGRYVQAVERKWKSFPRPFRSVRNASEKEEKPSSPVLEMPTFFPESLFTWLTILPVTNPASSAGSVSIGAGFQKGVGGIVV
jgi:hypothetical protein